MRRLIASALLGICCWFSAEGRQLPVKVSCIGDSITYGATLEDRDNTSYPAQLQALLGDGYLVGNFGRNGATLLRKGHRPYMEQEEFAAAMDFAGDVLVIHLGINDTDPRDWTFYRDDFVGDYLSLIDSLKSRSPEARLIIARMTPIAASHRRFISGTRQWHEEIQEAIELVAKASGAQLIDFYTPFIRFPWMFPDGLHPNKEGAALMAKTVYSAITGDFGGLHMGGMFSDNMVLPRDKVFSIRGLANAGDKVSVKLGLKRSSVRAGADGRWEVQLGPFAPSASNVLEVSAGGKKLRFKNVAFGDIWLCSGQSNMEFTASQSSDVRIEGDPLLRLYDSRCRWRTIAEAWPPEALESVKRLDYFIPARWSECSPDSDFSAVGYAFGKMLRDSLQVPVGLICNAVGGSTAEAWIDRPTLEKEMPDFFHNWLENDLVMLWARERAKLNLSGGAVTTRHPYEPCYLFESAIAPMEGFPISGVIWYQGESNTERAFIHERLFPVLVDSWRREFGADMPFYYVQLSSLERPEWPFFRDSQRRLAYSREGLGMAVTSDLGDPSDVHYRNKKAVGERLGKIALAKHYAHSLEYSGPVAEGFELSGAILRVDFSHAKGLSSAGEELTGFEVLDGATGLYKPVKAWVSGESVNLDISDIREASALRYGWKPFTRANLVNGAGLPASTFQLELIGL